MICNDHRDKENCAHCPHCLAAYWEDRYNDLRQQLSNSQKQVNTARDYLERLACLGNGDQHGNSIGNCLAIDALAAMEPK